MIGETVFFYIFSSLAILGALLVIQRKNPISSAMFLVLAFFAVAALFVLLGAHLLGALQILVYAGAIMVLILFVIMLLDLEPEKIGPSKVALYKILSVVAAIIFVFLLLTIPKLAGKFPKISPGFGEIEKVGAILYTRYAFPLEVAGILLLVAMIGVVILGKWRRAR